MTKSNPLHTGNLSNRAKVPATPYFNDKPPVAIENLNPRHHGRRQAPAGGALPRVEPVKTKGQ
jgi:hypothetical protein